MQELLPQVSSQHETTNNLKLIKEINDTRINCVDFSTKQNKLVYGCSNGYLKVKI